MYPTPRLTGPQPAQAGLVCGTNLPSLGVPCGEPAAWHILYAPPVQDATVDTALACPTHMDQVATHHVWHERHPATPACATDHATWHYGLHNHCTTTEETRMPTIAVDFDGVIHAYSKGWHDGTIYDPPLPGALEGLRALMEHAAVFIHTTRPAYAVARWLSERMNVPVQDEAPGDYHREFWNQTGVLLVTNRKLPALVYLDDRAVRFTSWPQALAELLPDEDTPLGRLQAAAAKANAGAPPLAMRRLRDIYQYVAHSDDDGIRTRETILSIIDPAGPVAPEGSAP